jgi:hypothetical protein
MVMRQELTEVIQRSAPHATLDIGADRWRLYVFGVSRVGADMFVQVAVVGPSIHTVTVRARAPIGNRETARRVLATVRDWVVTRGDEDQAFLELTNATDVAC